MDKTKIQDLSSRIKKELEGNIIPFWSTKAVDEKNGGFIGSMTNDGVINPRASKGLVLNTRILWSFSSFYGFYKKPEYLTLAKREYDDLMEHFWDKDFGGMFWLVDFQGKPQESRKQIYGNSFAIYALAEYYRVTGEKESLAKAMEIFDLFEKHAWDSQYGGYFESYDRDWKKAAAQQLTSGDQAAAKSMNTSLHAIEAIANLYDVNKDKLVGRRLEQMLNIYADYILHPYNSYSQLFFDANWYPKSEIVSFGHDIESAWLMQRDAEILGEERVLGKMKRMAVNLAESVYDFGLDNKKSMFYEADNNNNVRNKEKHWWVQAEAVVGYLNAYELTGREEYFNAAYDIWDFIENNIVDKKGGEWFWKVDAQGKVDRGSMKVSEWKCPYHNGRACIEIIQRLGKIV